MLISWKTADQTSLDTSLREDSKKTLALPRHWCGMNAFSLYFVCGAKEREREKQIERKRESERERDRDRERERERREK